MRRTYANLWSRAAAGLTAAAHTRAATFRWGVVIALTLIWIVGGYTYWILRDADPLQAAYVTISAVSMWDDYFHADDDLLQWVRFAAIATPVVSLLFAFSGQLGRSLARIFNLGAAHHVVIAGDSPAALSLALDCRGHKDAVMLIGQGLPDDTALDLRRRGVIVFEGHATQHGTLRAARAHKAAHVVAFEPDDTVNLQIEAAVRRLVGDARRKPPIGVHVSTRSPILLREAREMRTMHMRRMGAKAQQAPVDPKPFSLDEMAARALIQAEAPAILSLAEQLGQARLHLVLFGFDSAAEAVAARALMSLWSVRFGPPRVTVLTQDPASAEARFRARHREAFAHLRLWSADIAFFAFDWDEASMGGEVLDMVEAARGKASAVVVSTGADPGNIHLSIALKRVCNAGPRWPVPIYMHETSQSEFSQIYARGDDTPELDAYLQAFGAHQVTATRLNVLDGALDRGAAIAHEYYNKNLSERDHMRLKDLQAAMRDWSDVLEAYRSANRAVADSACVKMWDAGWRPALKGEQGDTAPEIPPDLIARMAQLEHDRWMAERLMAGWRPTLEDEKRNNDLMAHDKLTPWDSLTQDDKDRDAVQVRASVDIARLLHPQGYVKR